MKGMTGVVILIASIGCLASCESTSSAKKVHRTPHAEREDVVHIRVPAAAEVTFGGAMSDWTVTVVIPWGLPGAGTYSSVETGRKHPIYDHAKSAIDARRGTKDPEHAISFTIGVVGTTIREVSWNFVTKA
ncbi:MAG: hypothetical protein HYR85_13855 [Planctomycetes bacterium]|nr:hypothetical protein [Planctomycetota bacterium]MBI3843569.1 hypothetical protein [Planctomycetota bacterium]